MINLNSHFVVAATAWISRIFLALLQLANVRLLSDGLGHNEYGAYALLLGLSAWFLLADIGIPSALQNFISESRARGVDYDSTVAAWSVILTFFATLISLFAWFFAPWLCTAVMGNFHSVAIEIRIESFRVMAVASIVLASSSLIYKIWYAEHQGYLAHFCQLAGGVLAYVIAFLIFYYKISNPLTWCIFAYFGSNVIFPLICLTIKVKWRRSCYQFKRIFVADKVGIAALSFGGYGVMAALVLQLDYVLIATLLEPKDLVSYSIYSRIFGLGFFVYTSLLSALWPTLSERAAHGRARELMNVAYQYIVGGSIFIISFFIFVFVFKDAILRLISPNIPVTASASFILVFGCYYLTRVWSDTFAVVLQSMGYLRPFYLMVPAQAIISATCQFFGSKWFGLTGIPLGMGLSFLLTIAWAAPLLVRGYVRRRLTIYE